MQYTDNPARDWDAYCEAQEREAERHPRCSKCGERINEWVYDLDGDLFCEDCIDDFRHPVENYIEY